MAYQLSEIIEKVGRDPAAFLAECDRVYQQRLETAADTIASRLEQSPIVLLSGPSGSGKTTTAMKLEQALERRGINSHTVSLDNYFKSMDHVHAPRTPEGDIDYESPLLLDMDLLDESFTRLSRGEEIVVPKFEFARQMRNPVKGRPLQLKKNEIAIFEGIHALNDDIAGRHPEATGLYISARSDVVDGNKVIFKGTWMRIVRRTVRDLNFRGTDMVSTFEMWHNVRRGEKSYISPFKHRASIVLDSSLRYEVSVFANYADPLAQAVEALPRENPRREELKQMVAAFAQFPVIAPDLVDKDSLIREFIGGGSYKYH